MEFSDHSRERCRFADRPAGDDQHPGTGEGAGQDHQEQHHDALRSIPDSSRGVAAGRPSSTSPHIAPANRAPMRDQHDLPDERVVGLHEGRSEQQAAARRART